MSNLEKSNQTAGWVVWQTFHDERGIVAQLIEHLGDPSILIEAPQSWKSCNYLILDADLVRQGLPGIVQGEVRLDDHGRGFCKLPTGCRELLSRSVYLVCRPGKQI